MAQGDYPLPKFHFQVEWGGTILGFTEVSGLDVETEPIEYRHGAAPVYHKTKQPGLTKYSNITLKRGTFQSDNEFFTWWKETAFFQEGNATQSKYRRDITISLLNEEHNAIITWKVINAWPIKVQSTDLKADGNEVAIESIELVHEGLSIQND
jgi:phage tail-like protein